MSQRAVEGVLGRLITDVEFRAGFFAEPTEVCRENEIVLTPRETMALLAVSVQALHALTAKLDPKVVRAAIGAPVRGFEQDKLADARADRDERPARAGSAGRIAEREGNR